MQKVQQLYDAVFRVVSAFHLRICLQVDMESLFLDLFQIGEAVTPEEEKALKSGFMAKLQAGSVEPFVRKRGRTAMESVQIA